MGFARLRGQVASGPPRQQTLQCVSHARHTYRPYSWRSTTDLQFFSACHSRLNALTCGVQKRLAFAPHRAHSDPISSDRRSSFLVWSHFLRRTGGHFVGKCSSTESDRRTLHYRRRIQGLGGGRKGGGGSMSRSVTAQTSASSLSGLRPPTRPSVPNAQSCSSSSLNRPTCTTRPSA